MVQDAKAEALGYMPELSPVDPYEELVGPFFGRREPEGDFSYAFRVVEHHTNAGGIAHGGMLMTFADSVVANAAFAGSDSGIAVTLSMSTAFLAPARAGDLVECRPQLVRSTREIIFVDGDFHVEGKLVLTVKSLWKVVRFKLPDEAASPR